MPCHDNLEKWTYNTVQIDGNVHIFGGLNCVTKASFSSPMFHIAPHGSKRLEKCITFHHVISQ